MNDNKIIDGKLISNQIREKIKFFGEKYLIKIGYIATPKFELFLVHFE